MISQELARQFAQRIVDGQYLTIILPRVVDSKQVIRQIRKELVGSKSVRGGSLLTYRGKPVAYAKPAIQRSNPAPAPPVQETGMEQTLVTTSTYKYLGQLYAHVVELRETTTYTEV